MKIVIPTQCPCCGSDLTKINDQLFCVNDYCEAKTQKKIEHFCKVLGIKGLGPKSIEKLNIQDCLEIYSLDEEEVRNAVGQTLGSKILDQIEQSKINSISKILEAFSIPLLGASTAEKLSGHISSIDDINEEICKKAGLGDKVTQNVLLWKETTYIPNYSWCMPFTIRKQQTLRKVCITGKLKNYPTKKSVEPLLNNKGFTLSDNLTKDISMLVNESGKESEKTKKARDYGIPIIDDINLILN